MADADTKQSSTDQLVAAIRDEKQLQAIIDTAALGNPRVKEIATLASAGMLMRLPEASLGWTDKERPMSLDIRRMSVIMHLRLEALPGFKHILWMGNGFYPATALWVYKVNGDPNLKKLTAPEFKPLSPEEKEMFLIQQGDMCCSVTQTVEIGGIQQTWTGTGIIGADEIQMRDRNNKPYPGLKTVKERMKTLKTRAVNDMYARNYPIEGVTVSAEDMTDPDMTAALTLDVTPKAEGPSEEEIRAEQEKQDALAAAKARFFQLAQVIEVMRESIDPIVRDWPEIIKGGSASDIHDAADVLEHWLAEKAKAAPEPDPDPTPPPAAAAPKDLDKTSTAAQPEKKRGKGRPPGAPNKKKKKKGEQVNEGATIETLDLVQPPEPEAQPENNPSAPTLGQQIMGIVDNIFDDETPIENDVFATGESADGIPDEFALEPSMPPEPGDLVFQGTESQKESLRKLAAEAGITDQPALYALYGGMRGRRMHDGPTVIAALQRKTEPAAASPEPMANSTASDNTALEAARQRLRDAIELVISDGGAPMHILGGNPHNIIDAGSLEEIDRATQLLNSWQPPKKAAAPSPKPQQPAFPDFPNQGTGASAYALLQKWHGAVQVKPEVRSKIMELARRQLRDGDHLLLRDIVRAANNGDHRKLDEIIRQREPRTQSHVMQ